MRRILLILIMLGVLSGGVYWLYQSQVNSARAATAVRSTATLTRGSLVATVSAAGNLYAPQQTNLNFQLAGVPITKINVQVGDKVKAGDVLATVDDSDLQFQLRTATANLASAKAKLDQLKEPPKEYDLASAKAQVASAQAAYDAAVAKNNRAADQLTVAKTQLEKAAIALQSAQQAYNAVAWRSDVGMLSQSTALQNATIDYQNALANFNLTAAGINDSAVKSAAQALASAQANLAKLTQPASANDLVVAQAAVETAQTALDQAKRRLDQARIVAPFDGTIAAINYVVGQLSVSGGATPVIVLANLDLLQTQINLSEVDIARVRMGQDVTLTFDALNRRSFPGKIVSISPIGTITQGVVNYVVTVALTRPDPQVRPGMTAEAAITVDRRDNALLVPNRALRTQSGQRILTLLFEGQEVPLQVQVGLSNDQSSEILSATSALGPVSLQEGDVVVLNPSAAAGARTQGPGGFGFPMMIR